MPELPDVELIAGRLRRALRGARVVAASGPPGRMLRPADPAAFARRLKGRVVKDVTRRGKWLRIDLDGLRLFNHFGLTGWWRLRPVDAPAEPYERARLDAARGKITVSARYVDPRRFGRVVLDTADIPEWKELGPDPVRDGISAKGLADVFARSRRAVKDVIMDQTVLAGIGNIIATEALWHARLDPRTPCERLENADAARLVRELEREIRRELKMREGVHGDVWSDDFAVYGRTGKPCPRCRTTIKSAVVGGRTSAYCPRCQPRR